MKSTRLIVMLTYQDRTVPNAAALFAQCRNTPAEYWGFKEEGLPLPAMRELFAQMKACGKKTAAGSGGLHRRGRPARRPNGGRLRL